MLSILVSLALGVPAISLQDAAPKKAEFPELGLTLALPALEGLDQRPVHDKQRKALWLGKHGACEIEISLFVLPREEFRFQEPEDVTDVIEDNLGGEDARGFAFDRRELVAGPFGWAPYASLCGGDLHKQKSDEKLGRQLVLSGLLAKQGYALEVRCQPPPAAETETLVRDFLLHGVSYEGELRDPAWSDGELRARWSEFSPPDAVEKSEKPIRTEHYVILSNTPGAKPFAKKMEECYATIRKIYPFDEVAGRRRMPVFLFRTADQYYAYYAKIANTSLEQAQRSKGHSWRDYYATWYEAPNDPVHIHEATHQIFGNRLRLSGGGSWFQEGVAEYVSSKRNDLNDIARVVKSGKHTPLPEFVALKSLIASKEDVRGQGGAADQYAEAALLIEFLRESDFAKSKFPIFLQRVGRLPRSSPQLDATIHEIYGVDLAGLDQEFVRYCKGR